MFSFLFLLLLVFYSPAFVPLLVPPSHSSSYHSSSPMSSRGCSPPLPGLPTPWGLKYLEGCNIHELVFSFFFFERESLYAAQIGLKLSILLPSTCRVWDHRCTPPYPSTLMYVLKTPDSQSSCHHIGSHPIMYSMRGAL